MLRFSRPSLITYNYPPEGRSGNTGEANKVFGDYLAFNAKCKVFRKSGKLTYKYDNTCYLYIILSYLILSYIGDERARTYANVHERTRTYTNVHERTRTYVNDYERLRTARLQVQTKMQTE